MSSINQTLNSTIALEGINSNTDIAGIGILLSFMITAGVSILLSGYSLRMEFFKREVCVIQKILNSLSNQQIIIAIGILSIGLWDLHKLSLYHLHILWLLSILSTITHSSAICALANEIKSDWIVRWIQQFFVLVNFGLSIICSCYLFQAERRVSPQSILSIGSVLKLPPRPFWNHQDTSMKPWDFFKLGYIFLALALHLTCLKISRISRESYKDRRNAILVVKIGCFLVFTTAAYKVIGSVLTQSYAFGSLSIVLSDNKEKEWNIGQLLPMLLLILPVISAIELNGEKKRGLKAYDKIMAQPLLYEGKLSA